MKRDKIIQMLDQGRNMNLEVYEDDESDTPLMEAAADGNGEIVKMLIDRIFKEFNKEMAIQNFINKQDDLGATAFSLAMAAGFGGICKMLVAAGADPKKHLSPPE